MSQEIGTNLYLGKQSSHTWVFGSSGSGWPGNAMLQPQPLWPETDVPMSYTNPIITLNDAELYAFSVTVTNDGTSYGVYYNLQASVS